MKNLKSMKWGIGLAGTLAIVIAFNGIKASPSFDQAVLTASSQTQSKTSNQSSAKDQLSTNQGNSNSSNKSTPSSSKSNSQFNSSNSNSGNSFSQSPNQSTSRAPHTRSGRS